MLTDQWDAESTLCNVPDWHLNTEESHCASCNDLLLCMKGLEASTPEGEARADMIVNCLEDTVNGTGPIFFEKDAAKKVNGKYEEALQWSVYSKISV